jgi:hypothetical protein
VPGIGFPPDSTCDGSTTSNCPSLTIDSTVAAQPPTVTLVGPVGPTRNAVPYTSSFVSGNDAFGFA